MDRDRLIAELTSKGLHTENGHLQVIDTLGRGGNGVAFLCSGDTMGKRTVRHRDWAEPDGRES